MDHIFFILSLVEEHLGCFQVLAILHLSEWPRSKTLVTTHAGEDVGWGKHSYIAGVSTNWYSCFGNQDGDLETIRKLGNNPPQDPAIPLLGIYPKNAHSYHKDMCSTMFIAALFLIDRTWK